MILAGIGLIKYSKWITDNTMRFETAEKFLGPGGTYSVWKLFGIGVIAFGFYYIFNF
jgi:hypothetical protein